MSLDREQWITRPSKHKLRKNDKRFSFFKTKHIFQDEVTENHREFWPKTEYRRKDNVVSERAEDKLSFHAFISISKFLTKIDFFWGMRPLNSYVIQ